MLRLIRWSLAAAFLAWLFALAVAFRIHGHTVAEVACKLAGSHPCEVWAERCGAQVHRALTLFGYAEGPPSTERREKPPRESNPSHEAARAPAPGNATRSPDPVVVAPTDGPPLDQHSPQDRRALDKILTTRGSR